MRTSSSVAALCLAALLPAGALAQPDLAPPSEVLTLYDVAEAQARLAEAQASRAQAAYGLAFRVVLVRLAVGDVDPAELASVLE